MSIAGSAANPTNDVRRASISFKGNLRGNLRIDQRTPGCNEQRLK